MLNVNNVIHTIVVESDNRYIVQQNINTVAVSDSTVATVEVIDRQTNINVISPLGSIILPKETTNIITVGVTGPAGIAGTSEEDILLTASEERDIVNDIPAIGDFTIYDGVAIAANANTASAVWLITRRVIDSSAGYDSSKRFANGSNSYNQIWDNRLSHAY